MRGETRFLFYVGNVAAAVAAVAAVAVGVHSCMCGCADATQLVSVHMRLHARTYDPPTTKDVNKCI